MRFAKLDEKIEHALRHRPAEHAITAQLRRRVERDEQDVRAGRVGCLTPDLAHRAKFGSGARCAARERPDKPDPAARRGGR